MSSVVMSWSFILQDGWSGPTASMDVFSSWRFKMPPPVESRLYWLSQLQAALVRGGCFSWWVFLFYVEMLFCSLTPLDFVSSWSSLIPHTQSPTRLEKEKKTCVSF